MKLLKRLTTTPNLSPSAFSAPSKNFGMLPPVLAACYIELVVPTHSSSSDVLQQMPQLFPLCLQVFPVGPRRLHFQGHPVDYVDAVPFEADDLPRVVGHQANVP